MISPCAGDVGCPVDGPTRCTLAIITGISQAQHSRLIPVLKKSQEDQKWLLILLSPAREAPENSTHTSDFIFHLNEFPPPILGNNLAIVSAISVDGVIG